MENEKQKNQNKEFMRLPMKWDAKNMFKNFWNLSDDDLFPPKNFGIGYGINFHAILRAYGILLKKKK